MEQLKTLSPQLQKLVEKAATVLPAKVKKHKVSEVGEIIQSEFPIDFPITDTGMTVLIVACSLASENSEKDEAMIQTILGQGPKVNQQDKFGRTALHLACTSGNMPAFIHLMQRSDIQIDAQTIGGETPLMKAATMGHREIILQLIAAGANKGLASNNGLTAQGFAEINHKGTGLSEIL